MREDRWKLYGAGACLLIAIVLWIFNSMLTETRELRGDIAIIQNQIEQINKRLVVTTSQPLKGKGLPNGRQKSQVPTRHGRSDN